MDRQKILPMAKAVLVLAAIALASGLLLGFFNILTYVDPLQATLDGFKEDSGAAGEFTMVVDEETASGSGSVLYYAVSTDGVHAFLAQVKGGYGGAVQIYVYIRDNKIYKIVEGENSETYMYKLDEANFYAWFLDKDVSSLNVSGADLVSGATKSSTAVRSAIDAAVTYHNANAAGGESNGQG